MTVPDAIAPLQRTLGDRYRLERELGRGGMATVYLAHDLKHHRRVAIKVMHPELAASLIGSRFTREIEIAAQLLHPHILPLLDSGQVEGFPYYVMPFIEGESLRAKLTREGELRVPDAIRILRDIADALTEAHAHGVVHRDIKPDNVLLRGHHALVADFGVAKAVTEATGRHPLTSAGVALGTPAYMAPEQAAGEPHIDHRVDIYALGVMAYEMLTGHPPFTGTAQRILAAHVTESPQPIMHHRPTIPPVLGQLVMKCLEKKPADRWQSAEELRERLETLVTPSGGITPTDTQPIEVHAKEKSIVVLPFADLSPNRDNEYFGDGLAEEIITDLSKVEALRVISRNSAMQLKGTTKDTRTIGRELNVRYVLGGSVRKAGNSLRVTAHLVDTSNDVQLWAEKYTGTLEDVFDIQEKLSRTIVDALRVKLSPEADRRIGERLLENVQAYDCYLRARHEYHRFTEDSFGRALRLLQNGLQIVGDNALLYAMMGNIYLQYVNTLFTPDPAFLEKAEECLRKVSALAPDSSQAYALSGSICHKRGDIQTAVRRLKQALAVDPNDRDALYWLSYAYRVSGQADFARTVAKKLVAVDPLMALSYWATGSIELLDGNTELAVETFRKMCDVDPEGAFGWWALALGLAARRQYDEMNAVVETLTKKVGPSWLVHHGRFLKHALEGDQAAALTLADEDFKAGASTDETGSTNVAWGYAALGEIEEALDWLANAVRRGFIHYPFLAEHAPYPPALRQHPRFRELIGQVRERWQAFET